MKDPDLDDVKLHAGDAAKLLKSIGNEHRLVVLCLLAHKGEMTAGQLSAALPLSQSAASQHLARMRHDGLIECRRDAQTVHYRLADPSVKRIIAALREIFCP